MAIKKLTNNEARPLLARDALGPRGLRFLFAGVLLVCGIVTGTYYPSYLYAAFEQDTELGWTAQTTTYASTIGAVAESVGLFLAGPLGDLMPSAFLLGFDSLMCCVGMLLISLSHDVVLMVVIASVVLLCKGMLWPSVGSLIAANLDHSLHDKSFLVAALSSRVGDVVSSLVLGATMGLGVTWRHAVMILLLIVVSLVFVSSSIRPEDMAGPRDQDPSLFKQAGKWAALITSLEGWLALFTLIGTYFGWALINYAAVLFQDVHKLEHGEASAAASCFPVGMALGLISGAAFSTLLGVQGGRIAHVLHVIVGIAAITTLHFWKGAPLNWTMILLGLTAFGMAVPTYVPYLAYAASSPASDRAFRLASLDGVGCGVQVMIVYAYGRMRDLTHGQEGHAEQVASRLYGVTACGLTLACCTMSLLYYRLAASGTPRSPCP